MNDYDEADEYTLLDAVSDGDCESVAVFIKHGIFLVAWDRDYLEYNNRHGELKHYDRMVKLKRYTNENN